MSDKLMEFCRCMESIRTTIFQNLSLSAYLHFKLEIFVNKFINFSVSVCLSQSTHLIHSFITPVFNKHSYHFSKILMICSDFCIVEVAIVPFAFYHSSIKQAVSVNIFLVFLDLFNKQKFLLFSNMLWFIFATKVQHVMCCFNVITL